MTNIWTIEDCLEVLTGLSRYSAQNKSLVLDPSDRGIITSIARQVYKGTAMTDRQCELVIKKIKEYKDQFPEEVDVESVLEHKTLRMPLRSVDRSQWIRKLVINNKTFIAIRFPFSKKNITVIRNIERDIIGKSSYDEVEKIHYFLYNENNVLRILDAFKEKKFEIDQDLFDVYNELSEIKNNRHKHIPALRYKDNKLVLENCSDELIEHITKELGELTSDKVVQFVNRMSKYYIIDLDEKIKENIISNYSPLQQELIFNKKKAQWLDPKKYTISEIAESIWIVNRFPILLILENNDSAIDNLVKFRESFKGIVNDNEYSVLFRQEGNSHFNEYVKNHSLNNWFDEKSKVVVIEGKTMPKLLLKQDWYPNFIFSMTDNVNRSKIQVYFNQYDMLYYYCNKEPMTGIYFD